MALTWSGPYGSSYIWSCVDSLTVLNTLPHDFGVYKCVARNKFGTVTCRARMLVGGKRRPYIFCKPLCTLHVQKTYKTSIILYKSYRKCIVHVINNEHLRLYRLAILHHYFRYYVANYEFLITRSCTTAILIAYKGQ